MRFISPSIIYKQNSEDEKIVLPLMLLILIGINNGSAILFDSIQFTRKGTFNVMEVMMNKFLQGMVLVLVGVLLVLVIVFVGAKLVQEFRPETAEKQTTVLHWENEDGNAVVGDSSTYRLPTEWLGEYLEDQGYVVVDHGSWYQAVKDGLTISWGEWGEGSKLGQVDGIYEGKPLFIATRDTQKWVTDNKVDHKVCAGSFIASYSSEMSTWAVPDSTVIQFDGDKDKVQTLIDDLVSEWVAERVAVEGCVP